MDKYKEILIEESHLYGGSHTLKMWVHGLNSGFIVSDCVKKRSMNLILLKKQKNVF